nr:immunoglobulin heavy chain junction region [Macaca mulatta]MOX61399.1 immunoglobulin heavy chain junction region [Macaca mulatta]MOX61603.1 immunoglobulin heavy chain junction region [Macaca mulatta]MOX63027.1 immunoglobulin heavy chain junction region [Macaca mulatta]MOX64307.1 immunoglobulin heavy chain junction region [Macaca mulatta]
CARSTGSYRGYFDYW